MSNRCCIPYCPDDRSQCPHELPFWSLAVTNPGRSFGRAFPGSPRSIPHHEATMSLSSRRIVLTTVTALAAVAAAACASPTAPTAPAAMNSSLHSSSQVTPSDGVLVGSGN